MAPLARPAALTLGLLLAGCKPVSGPQPPPPTSRPALRVVTSFLPVHVFVLNIVGDAPDVSAEMLLPPAAGCPHDYDVSPADVQRLAGADVLVLMGGIDDAIREAAVAVKARAALISAAPSDLLDPHRHLADPDAPHDHNHGVAHPWVSPGNAIRLVQAVAAGLADADPSRAEGYRRNAETYVVRLQLLADEVAGLAAAVRGKRIAAVHEIFDDLAADLGLEIVATIRAPGHDVDPSPRDMADIIQRIRSAGAAVVFSEPQYPAELAKQIARQAGVPCRRLDPLAGASGPPRADDYERVMRENLAVIREVLTR